jgi:hypothetical protein
MSTELPWPKPFPTYKGLNLFLVDDSMNGHGTHVWMETLHGDTAKIDESTKTISIETSVELVSVCEDTFQEMKDNIGHSTRWRQSGSYDVDLKCFRLDQNSAEVLDDGMVEYSEPPRGYECVLSSDNSIVRAIDSEWIDSQAQDPDDSICFMFRMRSSSTIVPTLLPGENSDKIASECHEMRRLVLGAKFAPRDPEAARTVYLDVEMCRISKISTLDESFDAKLIMTTRWLVDREDIYRYVMTPKEAIASWEPAWVACELEVVNAESDGSVGHYSSPIQIIKDEDDGNVYAERRTEYSGSFHEPLELGSFPFDTQPMNVFLVPLAQQYSTTFILMQTTQQTDSVQNHNSEWTLTSVKFDMGCDRRNASQLQIITTLKRRSTVYVVRIICVMSLIQVLTLTVFAFEDSDVGDQLGIAFTMLLTAVAYSLVVSSTLPTLGYLTFLDSYILTTFVVIAIVIAQVIILFYLSGGPSGSFSGDASRSWHPTRWSAFLFNCTILHTCSSRAYVFDIVYQ